MDVATPDFMVMRILEEVQNIQHGVVDQMYGLKMIMEFACIGVMKIDLEDSKEVPF